MAFALLISEKNLEQIAQFDPIKSKDILAFQRYYANKPRQKYYIIRGYVTRRGRFIEWTVLPQRILNRSYDWDEDQASTSWSQIVRKD